MAPKKRRPLTKDDALIPVRDLTARRVLIISYNPISDAVEIDAEGLTALEVRGMIDYAAAKAQEEL